MHPMQPFRDAIASVESGGNYGSVGPPTRSGDRAYGRYQVMGNQVPEWTQSALGYSMTPQDFLKNPEAQDTVFDHYFGGAMNKYGNPQDAASVWFSGRPMSQAGNSDDGYINVPTYVSRFNKALGQPTPETNTPSPMKQAMNSNSNGAPSMADNGILSAVQNYGPGALFGAGQPDFNAATGLMGLGAGLTVAGGDAKGGSGMMNSAMLPMFKQRYQIVSDPTGVQRVFDLHRGMFVSGATGPGGAAGGVGADGTTMDRSQSLAQTPLALKNQIELQQKSSQEKFDKLDASANDAQGMIDELQKAKRLSQDPNVAQGGFTAELLDHAKSAAAGLGINLPGAAQTAELDKIHGDITGKYLSTLNGMTRIAGPELKFGSMSTPGLDKPDKTNQNIYDNMIENLQRGIAARDLARQHMSQYGVLGPRYSQELQAQQDQNPVYTDTSVQASPPKGSGKRPPLSSFSK